MYSIQVTITIKEGPWTRSRQIPTFYLDERVQGISDKEHAATIALEILDPTGDRRSDPDYAFHITAVLVD